MLFVSLFMVALAHPLPNVPSVEVGHYCPQLRAGGRMKAIRQAYSGNLLRLRNKSKNLAVYLGVKEVFQGEAWICCPHEGLTDQEGIYSSCAKPRDVGPRGDAAFCDNDPPGRNPGHQIERRIEPGLERA